MRMLLWLQWARAVAQVLVVDGGSALNTSSFVYANDKVSWRRLRGILDNGELKCWG